MILEYSLSHRFLQTIIKEKDWTAKKYGSYLLRVGGKEAIRRFSHSCVIGLDRNYVLIFNQARFE
jgi:hypothetical protein